MRLFLFALCLGVSAQLSAEKDTALPGWMSGSWERSDGKKWADEIWTSPRAGIMLGASRSGDEDQLRFWEHMRIVRDADGTLAFWAIAGDQKAVRFAATSIDENSITFENGEHDYPQRIRYWREKDVLMARISLLDGSKAVQFHFDLAAD